MYVGHLAAFRHESLRTNAFDLGYVSQTLWNTSQGQLFRFTTLDGVGFRPEGLDPSTFRNPNSLLAFHIEPILIPISLLYRIYPDPRLLLWLQALLLASGAFPMALLGRQLIGGWRAGLVVGFGFLLAPGLQGAALSDFHAVAIAATWIGWMLWAIESKRWRLALVFGALTTISREDAALLVAWLGAVLFVQRLIHRWVERRGRAEVLAAKPVPNHDGFLDRELAVPAALFLGGGLWAVACFGFIAPRFNGGGSAFWYRYAWLGETPATALKSILADPRPLFNWLATPDVSAYIAIQLLTGGIWGLAAPFQLLVAAPIIAMNSLSSFDWMHSGGAHYSAILVPVLVWSGVRGARWASHWFPRYGTGVVLAVFAASASTAHLWIGVSPVRLQTIRPAVDPRATNVLAAMASIPPDAEVSATSALYPHLSTRSRVYWFSAHADAPWLAIDALGTTHPLSTRETRELVLAAIASGRYDVESAAGGAIVLRASDESTRSEIDKKVAISLERIMRSLLSVAEVIRIPESSDNGRFKQIMPPTKFGESLEMVGYRITEWPEVGLGGGTGILETYWLSNQPVGEELHFSLAKTRHDDGAIVGLQTDAAPLAVWFQTSDWPVGKVIRLTMPFDHFDRVRAVGVAVSHADGTRIPILRTPETSDRLLWENDTIAGLKIE